jgi:FlaA1/EpsC-like NDP-sugar epimerase
MESNPIEAVRNNVFGTKNLVEASVENDIRRFVLISTDKAVEPSSVYGASKAIAEDMVLSANGGKGAFMVVRFGNVLGSRGSIVPLFRKQILKGGPVTITDPEASRFFMTIPEAASLVLKAGGVGENRNLYILDMGEPICIRELAEQMIKFHGYRPYNEISITYIGLRPGEKVKERLWSEDDVLTETEHSYIHRLIRKNSLERNIDHIIEALKPICYFDPGKSEQYRNRLLLKQMLHRFIPTLKVYDNEPEY